MPRKSKKGGAAQSPKKKDTAASAQKQDTKSTRGRKKSRIDAGKRSSSRHILLRDQIRKVGLQVKVYAEQMQAITQPVIDCVLTEHSDIERQSKIEAVKQGVGLYRTLKQAADLVDKAKTTRLTAEETELCARAEKQRRATGLKLTLLTGWDSVPVETDDDCMAVWEKAEAQDSDLSVPYEKRHAAIEWLHGAQYAWLTQHPVVLHGTGAKLEELVKAYDKKKLLIWAIIHDSDEVEAQDSPFLAATEKWHLHLYMLPPEGMDGHGPHIDDALKALGIAFRRGYDESLLDDKAKTLEYIRSVQAAALYCTHDTEQAVKDMKHKYDVTEVMTNMTPAEFQALRLGQYEPMSRAHTQGQSWEVASRYVRELGQQGKDGLQTYLEALPFSMRSNASAIRTLKQDYEIGVRQYVKDRGGEVDRCVIFIEGPGGIGKSFSSRKVLETIDPDCKTRSLTAASGTGTWDKVSAFNNLVIDDYTIKHPLGITDQAPCDLYHRGRDNTLWCGKYLIITANTDLDTWAGNALEASGESYDTRKAHMEPLKSRMYYLTATMKKGIDADGVYYYTHYVVKKVPSRFGDAKSEKALRLKELFDEFLTRLNKEAQNPQLRYRSTNPSENPWYAAVNGDGTPAYRAYGVAEPFLPFEDEEEKVKTYVPVSSEKDDHTFPLRYADVLPLIRDCSSFLTQHEQAEWVSRASDYTDDDDLELPLPF